MKRKRAELNDNSEMFEREYSIIELSPKDSKLLPKKVRMYSLESVDGAVSRFAADFGRVPEKVYTINGYVCIEIEPDEENKPINIERAVEPKQPI